MDTIEKQVLKSFDSYNGRLYEIQKSELKSEFLITKQDVEKYAESLKLVEETKEIITKRVKYVLNFVYTYFGANYNSWRFNNEDDSIYGRPNINQILNDDSIFSICIEDGYHTTYNHNLFKSYNYGFPVKFLYMTDEEILKYLNNQKFEYDETYGKKEKEKELEKLKKEKLKIQALEKLTTEERRVLEL